MCGLLSPLEESGIDWRSLNQVLQGQYMSLKPEREQPTRAVRQRDRTAEETKTISK